MTEEVHTRGWLAPDLTWLVRRWPTWLAVGLVFLTGFGLDDGRDLASLLILLALGYLVSTVVGRRDAACWVALAGTVVISPVRLGSLDQMTVLLVVAAGFVALGALPKPAGFRLQTAATVVLALTALLALNADPVVGGSLVAAGLFGHAAWGLYHHRADKVVTRSFAESWAVLDSRPIRPPQKDTGEHMIRLLGRKSELERLLRAARQACEGSLALLQIEGDTGLGKTRLLDELAASLAAVRVGRATCSALEEHLPYVPLAAALRDALRGIDLDGQQRRPLRRILPELGLTDPAQEFAEVDALEALVALVAEQAPLVLLLDDLHWADPHTLAALSYLQRRGAGTPVAVVTTVRSEQTPPGHPVLGLRPDVVVRLQPLSPAELAPLGIRDLHDLTAGNPRFVLEAIAKGNRAEPSAAFAKMLLAQCRAEGAWAYRMLMAASALEQPFEPEPLATALQADTAEVVHELERLCERRILRVDGHRFGFRYQLVRDVLLANLSPARQRLLHQRLHPPEESDERSSVPTNGTAPLNDVRGRLARAFQGRTAAGQTATRSTAPVSTGPVVPLTEREVEVLQLLVTGKRNREIANELYVTCETIKKHVTHILGKLGAESRTQAAARAYEIGLVG